MAVNPTGSDMTAFRAFSEMVRDPGYQESTHLRADAVTEAVLRPTTPR